MMVARRAHYAVNSLLRWRCPGKIRQTAGAERDVAVVAGKLKKKQQPGRWRHCLSRRHFGNRRSQMVGPLWPLPPDATGALNWVSCLQHSLFRTFVLCPFAAALPGRRHRLDRSQAELFRCGLNPNTMPPRRSELRRSHRNIRTFVELTNAAAFE